MSTTEIPTGPDEVTPAFLTSALQAAFPGIEVVGTQVLRQDSGTTGRMRLGLEHAAGSEGPESVFVKLPPDSESQQRLVAATDMGRREARFYESLAAEMDMRIPLPYHAAHGDEPTQYVMVLEDLDAAGCEFKGRSDPLDDEQTGRLVQALARSHAHFWKDPRFDGELGWVPGLMRGGYAAKLIGMAKDQFADEMGADFTAICDLYLDHSEGICDLWEEGDHTLVHGDTHSGNQIVDGDQVGLYDWAVISRAPGVRDIAICLGNSCPTDLRRAHQDEWMEMYRRTLVDAGVPDAPTLDEVWTRFRHHVLYAWIASTSTAAMGSKWQPIEVGMAGMRTATDSCIDLDVVGSIRDAL